MIVEVADLAALASDQEPTSRPTCFPEPVLPDPELAGDSSDAYRAGTPTTRLERDERLADWLTR